MLNSERLRAGLAVVMLALAPAAVVAQQADRVYVNGIVYTVDDVFSKASAFAVKDGEFIGVVVATGTDYPVSPYNPFYTLHAAVTRQDRDNNPSGGWFPEEALSREQALRAATMAGAYAMHAEDILGSIEVGKLADFVVIPVDYMTIPAEDIWKITPDITVVGGEVVYSRPVGD